MKKKIFITGGHFTPAKAVVDELLKQGGWEVFYIGRKHALEGDKALSLEYQELRTDGGDGPVHFLEIITGRFQRRFSFSGIISLLKVPIGLFQAFWWTLRYQPKIIMSFGGHVAIPVATVGRLFGVPVLNHEQVPVFDFPSRYLSWVATRVLVSFPHLLIGKDLTKWVFTGNPVRRAIFRNTLSPELVKLEKIAQKEKKPVLYLTGGNQGSHVLNAAFLEILPEIISKCLVIWQTGDSQTFHDFDRVSEFLLTRPKSFRDRVIVRKFITEEEIGAVFSLADFVIGRSGANTVSELAVLEKPAILVPIPWVHDAEQQKNAESLTEFGGAIILPQSELSPERFLQEIETFIGQLDARKKSARNAKALNSGDAASQISAQIEKLID